MYIVLSVRASSELIVEEPSKSMMYRASRRARSQTHHENIFSDMFKVTSGKNEPPRQISIPFRKE